MVLVSEEGRDPAVEQIYKLIEERELVKRGMLSLVIAKQQAEKERDDKERLLKMSVEETVHLSTEVAKLKAEKDTFAERVKTVEDAAIRQAQKYDRALRDATIALKALVNTVQKSLADAGTEDPTPADIADETAQRMVAQSDAIVEATYDEHEDAHGQPRFDIIPTFKIPQFLALPNVLVAFLVALPLFIIGFFNTLATFGVYVDFVRSIWEQTTWLSVETKMTIAGNAGWLSLVVFGLVLLVLESLRRRKVVPEKISSIMAFDETDELDESGMTSDEADAYFKEIDDLLGVENEETDSE